MEYELIKSDEFADWLNGLKDRVARVKILQRMERARFGNFGDHKHIGGGLIEMRINFAKGYRLYCSIQNGKLVVLLTGGTKEQQQKDIDKARALLKIWENTNGI
ncbi:MAG: type II toxin-antitoxin system RelE/ParE family toxin [Neisseriaceae bacterium]|nr:type II toxin-antitoxin system RelE/ParE family toxin [Neisseriaceae bacterium]